MAQITAYTADRMKAIEDSTIVDANVVGDNLILVRHDGDTIDAGNIKGPQGIQGPAGSGFTVCTSATRPSNPVEGNFIYETDTDTVYFWSGTDWVGYYKTIGVPPKAKVNASAAQTIHTGAWTAVNYNQETFDNDAMHDNVTNNTRLTCKTAGHFFVKVFFGFASSSGGSVRHLGLRKNGSGAGQPTNGWVTLPSFVSSAYTSRMECSDDLDLAVNDYVEVVCYQDTGADLNSVVDAANHTFSCTRLGD